MKCSMRGCESGLEATVKMTTASPVSPVGPEGIIPRNITVHICQECAVKTMQPQQFSMGYHEEK